MNFNEFVNNWLPNHCPIHPWSGVWSVHIYVDSYTNNIKSLHWLSRTSFGWQLNVHDTESNPIPTVVYGLQELTDHVPTIHIFKVETNNN